MKYIYLGNMLTRVITRQLLAGINTAYHPEQECNTDPNYTRRLSTLKYHAEQILYELMEATYNKDRPLRKAAINAIKSDPTTRESAIDLFTKLIAPVIAEGYNEREQVLEGILKRIKIRCKRAISGIEKLGQTYHDSSWTLESEAEKVYTDQQHGAYRKVFEKYLNS
jgi:hypothetical protein